MMQYILTVVVPIHNMHKKLNRLDEWISTIHGPEVEVILVDDFTSEESSREIKDLVDFHSSLNIFLVSGQFKSPGRARNAGLSKARGIWVIFADSDDILHLKPVLAHLAKSEPKSIEVFQFRELDFGSAKVLKSLSKTSSEIDLVVSLGIWRVAFPASFLVGHEFTQIRMGEDLLFFLDVVEANSQINFNSIHSYDYLIGSGIQLTADTNAVKELTLLLGEIAHRANVFKNAKSLAELMYFKNTLSVAKHLGLIKCYKFAWRGALMFLFCNSRDKKKFIEIVVKTLRP
jgi:glycosyltransferase involved in cell wall biosynthesis